MQSGKTHATSVSWLAVPLGANEAWFALAIKLAKQPICIAAAKTGEGARHIKDHRSSLLNVILTRRTVTKCAKPPKLRKDIQADTAAKLNVCDAVLSSTDAEWMEEADISMSASRLAGAS